MFLLGESRWEEPSRLIGKDKQGGVKKVHGSPITCIACRGEGRLMCTGLHSLSINPFEITIQQFMIIISRAYKSYDCIRLNYLRLCGIVNASKTTNMYPVAECDGTGEPNIEPQVRSSSWVESSDLLSSGIN